MSDRPERVNLSRRFDHSIDFAELRSMNGLRVGLMDLAATLTAYQNLPRNSTPRRPFTDWCWWTLTFKEHRLGRYTWLAMGASKTYGVQMSLDSITIQSSLLTL